MLYYPLYYCYEIKIKESSGTQKLTKCCNLFMYHTPKCFKFD